MCGVTGAIISGGAALAGSVIGANKQAGAARDAARLSQDQFQTINQQQQPFIQPGYAATSRLSQLLGLSYAPQISATPGATPGYGGGATGGPGGQVVYNPNIDPKGYQIPEAGWYGGGAQMAPPLAGPAGPAAGNPEDFGSLLRPFDAQMFGQYKDPGYEFRRQQGEQAVRNAAAAGSGALSGAALKDLLMFNQDAASTEYGNAFNRYQTQQGNIFSRLSGIAQLGQSAAAGVGQQGTALAGQAGQALSNAGTAAGAGAVGAGNAISNAASNYWLSQVIKGG